MAEEKRIFKFDAEVKNVEIRGVKPITDSFTSKDGKLVEYKYLEIACDDEYGERIYFKDKNVANVSKYKRGMIGDIKLRIDVETGFKGRTKITLIEFIENKD